MGITRLNSFNIFKFNLLIEFYHDFDKKKCKRKLTEFLN